MKPILRYRLAIFCATAFLAQSALAAPAADTVRPKPRYGAAKPVQSGVQQRNQAYAANADKAATGKPGVRQNPKRADHYKSMTRAEFQKKNPVQTKVERPKKSP